MSGGRCAFPGCWERLCYHEAEEAAPFTLGEMAHICGDKSAANRHDVNQTDAERDDYQNLILLCPTHHTRIDRKENEIVYTVAVLHAMKAEHEARVLVRLDQEPMKSKADIASAILPLLEENRQSWDQYGPLSDLAKTQPYNGAAHAVWLSERHSVIIPNNRKIAAELDAQKGLFVDADERALARRIHGPRAYHDALGRRRTALPVCSNGPSRSARPAIATAPGWTTRTSRSPTCCSN